jgi:hypothetical protein
MSESESDALPLGYTPKPKQTTHWILFSVPHRIALFLNHFKNLQTLDLYVFFYIGVDDGI